MNRELFNMYIFLIAFNLLFTILQIKAEPCKTPKDEPGDCMSLKLCPSLLKMITENKTDSAVEFVRRSICGFILADSKVCCPSQSNLNTTEKQNKQKENKSLLPDRRYCGYQHSDDFGDNNNDTLITEFPWLARIIEDKKHKNISKPSKGLKHDFLCLGSLINVRYVLTAAHCFRQKRKVKEVQLGEYHVANKTDCVSEFQGIEECSDPVQSYRVEKIIVHPQFGGIQLSQSNDIALIRLNESVTYSDYIRPICLPYPGTRFANAGDILTISGWGFINEKKDEAIIKKKVLATLLSQDNCATLMNAENSRLVNKLCTRTLENSTASSCIGDSGAPVIFSHRLQWHQEGIVSLGVGICGTRNRFPDVHTRVEKYLDWIEENIET